MGDFRRNLSGGSAGFITKGLCQRKIGWVQHFLKLTFFKIYGLFWTALDFVGLCLSSLYFILGEKMAQEKYLKAIFYKVNLISSNETKVKNKMGTATIPKIHFAKISGISMTKLLYQMLH